MVVPYRKFRCLNPRCWFAKTGKKGKWRLYYTDSQLKVECRCCGFVLRFPLSCDTCGAQQKMLGGISGVLVTYDIQDIEYVQIRKAEESD